MVESDGRASLESLIDRKSPLNTQKKPECPSCHNKAEWYKGKIYCRVCKKPFEHVSAPRILFLDIEKSRIKVEVDTWEDSVKRREVKISPDDVTEDWFLLSWAACWIFEETFGAVVTPKEAKNRDDKRIVKQLRDVMKLADFVVTYNGNKFDLKKINWRLMYHRLPPMPHLGSMDVMQKIKDVASPTSLGLDFLARQLGYDGKAENPPHLWERCEAGEKEMLDHLLFYNKVDVDKTHDVYLHTRAYWKRHPNFAAFLDIYQEIDKTLEVGSDAHRCSRCLKGVVSNGKFKKRKQTPAGFFYKTALCPHCGCVIYKVHREREDYQKVSQKVYVRS